MFCWKYTNYVYEQSYKIADFTFDQKVWKNKNQEENNEMMFEHKKWWKKIIAMT